MVALIPTKSMNLLHTWRSILFLLSVVTTTTLSLRLVNGFPTFVGIRRSHYFDKGVVVVARSTFPAAAPPHFYGTRDGEASISDTTTTIANIEHDTAVVVSTSLMLGHMTPLPLSSSSSSFVEAMRIPTFLCSGGGLLDNNNNCTGMVAQNITWNHHHHHNTTTSTPTTDLSSSSRYGPAMTISSVLTPFMCQDIIQACDMAIYNHHLPHRNITTATTDTQPSATTTTTPLKSSSSLTSSRPIIHNISNNKNQHGAMQLLVSHETADSLAQRLAPYIPISRVEDRKRELEDSTSDTAVTTQLRLVGMNRRWRVYKYAPNQRDQFQPHIDAGFPPSGVVVLNVSSTTHPTTTCAALQFDDTIAYLDRLQQQQQGTGPWWSNGDHHNVTLTHVVSRLTILIYLNDNFTGGTTNFYEPLALQRHNNHDTAPRMIASIAPQTGMVLIFPQCVGAKVMETYAQYHWPTHEGSPVHTGSPESKYVIRSDLLFAQVQNRESQNFGTEDGL